MTEDLGTMSPVATPVLGLSLSYEMREGFVRFKFCETSLKLFNLIYIKSKEEARHRINHQCLWWQLFLCSTFCLAQAGGK